MAMTHSEIGRWGAGFVELYRSENQIVSATRSAKI
jgi:hypothetical protein